MDTTVAAPADKHTARAAKRVNRALAGARTNGYSEDTVAEMRRTLRNTGQRATRRQLAHLLNLAAGSAA